MECENYINNGAGDKAWSDRQLLERELGYGGALQICGSPVIVTRNDSPVPVDTKPVKLCSSQLADILPIGDMDEITYWIYTKRAPCLMTYDSSLIKRDVSRPSLSNHLDLNKPLSISDDSKPPSPKKKKKRKLSLLEEDSVSEKGHENVYFDSSNRQQLQKSAQSSCKSSDIEFNIKKSSIQEKVKRRKTLCTTIHKKNKIVSSTPKTNTSLRRSLRNSRKAFNDSSHFNSSFEALNGVQVKVSLATKKDTPPNLTDSKDKSKIRSLINNNKTSEFKINEKFDDLSDVSGFTANYIRSTKLCSTKNKKRAGKNDRSFLKKTKCHIVKTPTEPNESVYNNDTLKYTLSTINHDLNALKNVKQYNLGKNISKKFTPPKNKKSNNEISMADSLTSPNSSSRYPKRQKNNSSQEDCTLSFTRSAPKKSLSTTKRLKKDLNNIYSNHTENSGSNIVSHARRNCNVANISESVVVLSNTSEHVSSATNVCPKSKTKTNNKPNSKNTVTKIGRPKNSLVKIETSLRDKSGFAACFSDSDDDIPLKTQFFC